MFSFCNLKAVSENSTHVLMEGYSRSWGLSVTSAELKRVAVKLVHAFIDATKVATVLQDRELLYQRLRLGRRVAAVNSFWYPTPELRAAMELPRFSGIRFKAVWKASWSWPVIWRRLVVMFVAMQLWNVDYLAVRGFEKEAVGVARAETPEFPIGRRVRIALRSWKPLQKMHPGQSEQPSERWSFRRFIFQLCTCTAETIATNMTAKDIQEINQGGAHVTPHYRELLDQPRPLERKYSRENRDGRNTLSSERQGNKTSPRYAEAARLEASRSQMLRRKSRG